MYFVYDKGFTMRKRIFEIIEVGDENYSYYFYYRLSIASLYGRFKDL